MTASEQYLSGKKRKGTLERVCPICRKLLNTPPEQETQYPSAVRQVWTKEQWRHVTDQGQRRHERLVSTLEKSEAILDVYEAYFGTPYNEEQDW